MALMPILEFPDPRLREQARAVDEFDAQLLQTIDDMFETMYAAPGVGLAATQVGIALRFAVMDCSAQKDEPIVMVNPQIIERAEPITMEEGCLSVPGYYDKVLRFRTVGLRAQDRHGEWFELGADGLKAQCIQHEIDHLDGKLYIDYLSRLKRERIRRRLEKEQRRR